MQLNGRLKEMVHRVQTQSASVRGVMVMLLLDLMLVIK